MSITFPDMSESPWTHPETGTIYEYADGMWRPQDPSGGGGNGGGGNGGGGGGGNIGSFSLDWMRVTQFAPSGLVESCGPAKIGNTIVAAGIPRSWMKWGKPFQKFAVSTDDGKSWTYADCPIDTYKIDCLSEGGNGKFYAIAYFNDHLSKRKSTILESGNGLDWVVVNDLPRTDIRIATLTFVGSNLIVTANVSSATYAWTSTDYGKTLQSLTSMQYSSGYHLTSRMGLPDGGAVLFTSHSNVNNFLFSPGSLTPTKNVGPKGYQTITKSGHILRVEDTPYTVSNQPGMAVFRTKAPITSADDFLNAEWEKLDSNIGYTKMIRFFESLDVNGTRAEVMIYTPKSTSGTYSQDWTTTVSFDEGENWSIVASKFRPKAWGPSTLSRCSTNPVSEFPYWREQSFPAATYDGSNGAYADAGFTLLFDDLKNL